jgi:hypothetical protein
VPVRVDQRRERPGGTHDRVQVEAQLANYVVVGAEAGRVHDHVGQYALFAGGQFDPAVRGTGCGLDPEAAHKFDLAGLDELLEAAAERAAGG